MAKCHATLPQKIQDPSRIADSHHHTFTERKSMKASEADECMPTRFDQAHSNLLTCSSTLRQNIAAKLPEV